MDRASEALQEQQYFADRAADAMLHLERAKKARLNRPRSFAEPVNYSSMADEYHALAEVQAILKEFHISKVEVPKYLSEEWVNVIQAGRK